MDVIVSRFDKPEVASALAEAKRNGDEIEEFDFDADGSQREEMHHLVHALWSKAAAAAD